ncbi:MAG: Ferrous iron transport protein B [Syntrophorhabdus sp. PtaB.Bin184]|nr:MAG: Ferrous iron transport protein B [Syntrophorhabdus sp. PtaB.Bin184]
MSEELFPVTALDEGQEATVRLLSGGEALTGRLAAMGIIPGTRIKLLRKSRGQIIVLASDTRVALGKGQAEKILVKREGSHEAEDRPDARRSLLVALAGQPNVGKTTVFNLLTGLSQHIGNWPGKTVERKEGIHRIGDTEITLVDLPGTYSLSAYSEEERVTREFLIHEHPDVTVLFVNASALERSLYLLTELLLLRSPVIVAVNMFDVAENQGVHVEAEALAASLGLPVVSTVATKNKGIRELLEEILKVAENPGLYKPKIPRVTKDHHDIYMRISELVRDHVPVPYTVEWVVTKLMEGDSEVTETFQGMVPSQVWSDIQSLLVAHEDALRAVVGGRYDWIEDATRAAVSRFRRGQVLMTDRIDHVLTRPLTGIPVLLAILAIVFLVTFAVGYPLQGYLESLVASLGTMVQNLLEEEPQWIRGLLVDGIIGGAGSVVTFVPILLIFFFAMSFLENVGYMARAAFVMDRFMHIIGLHGKSFLPMCLGFGCNVASVLGARIVESRRARLLTIFLTPFVPCTGRLAVITFVAAAVFAGNALVVTWFLVALNVVMLGVAGMFIGRFLLRQEAIPFIMELPLYHKPDFRTIGLVVWHRTVAFIKKAGTVILLFSVFLWILSNIPPGSVEKSVLGRIGTLFEPLGRPLGLDWRMVVALLSSVIAKENSVATLGVLYNVGDQGLMAVLSSAIPHASALSFLVVLMLFIPCAPTIVVMKQEMNDRKWFIISFLFMLFLSYVMGVAAYSLARAAGI